MPVLPNSRHDITGAAQETYLVNVITASEASLALVDASTWPDGDNPIPAIINRGQPNEEKVYLSNKVGNTYSNVERAADGTLATVHQAGEPVEHCVFARHIDEANQISALWPNVQTQATSGGALATAASNLINWTPTFSAHPSYATAQRPQPSLTSVVKSQYVVLGKICFFQFSGLLKLLTTGGTGPEFLMSLPVTPAPVGQAVVQLLFQNQDGHVIINNSGLVSLLKFDHSTWLSNNVDYGLHVTGFYFTA